MSRSDIADFLGLSLESVSRAAADLERQGVVKFENRHLARILDPRRLAKIVGRRVAAHLPPGLDPNQ